MQRKFERRAAAMLAVLALTCAGVGLAQTSTVAAPPQPQNPDAIVAQMAAQLPPPVTAPSAAPVAAAATESQPTAVSAPVAAPAPAPQTTVIPPAASAPAMPGPSALAAARPPVSAQMTAPVGPGEVGADYVLGSADKIRITVFGEPSLTGEYFVSSSGKVSLPLAGEVQAAGLTLRDFHDHVVKSLQDGYLKDPKVSLEVLTFRPFYILGEVSKPGQYPYTSGLTVFNAVATAGGFTYRANTRKVLIKRASEPAEHEVPLSAETTISPGDTIRIPERFF